MYQLVPVFIRNGKPQARLGSIEPAQRLAVREHEAGGGIRMYRLQHRERRLFADIRDTTPVERVRQRDDQAQHDHHLQHDQAPSQLRGERSTSSRASTRSLSR